MAGVWCPRCQAKVILEQDDQSCSNCGRKLVIAAPTPPPPPPRGPRTKKPIARPA